MALLTNINGKLTVDSTGSVSFNRIGTSTTTGFTFPALDGSANQILKTNGSGILSWVDDEDNDVVTKIIGGTNITVSPATGIGDVTVNADLAGTVTGSGTLNKVARWTATGSDIGDGPITFSTNDSSFAGNILMGNTVVNPASGFADQTGIGLKYSTTVPELQVSSDAAAMQLGRTTTGGDGQILGLRKEGTVITSFSTNASQFYNLTSGQTGTVVMYSEGGGEVGLTVQSRTNRGKIRVADNDSNAYVVAEAGKAFYGTSANGDATNIAVLTSGNVGIGNTDPVKNLDVRGSLAISNSSTSYWYLDRNDSSGTFDINTDDDVTRLKIDFDSNITIGTSGGGINEGAILLQNDHYVNKRFSFDPLVSNAPTAYMILCENAANQDVNGIITMDRTSGLRHACSIQVLVSSGSGTSPVAGLKAMGVAGASTPFYQLVTCDYDDGTGSSSHIAVQMSNPDGYYETSGAYFTGRIVNSKSGVIVPVLPAAVSNVVIFEENCKHNFQGDLTVNQGNIGVGNSTPSFAVNTNYSMQGSPLAYLNGTSANQTVTNNIGVTHSSTAVGTGTEGGLYLANNDLTTNAPSPIIFFSAKSASTTYNHAYAAIYGIKTASGADSNWNRGELTFATGDGTGPRRRMTIDTNGKVGIGTDSPTYNLVVSNGGASGVEFAINTASGLNEFLCYNRSTAAFETLRTQALKHEWYTNATVNAMVILDNGDVGIGTASPDATLHVDASGGGVLRISRLATSTTNYMQFENDGTNGTIRTEGSTIFRAGGSAEKFRIQSSAQTLRVKGGAVTGSNYMQFVNSAETAQGYFGYGGSSNVLYIVQQVAGDIAFYTNSAVRGSISQGGTLTMGGDVVAYGSPSDKRLKENIKPIESALDKVSKLQGVTFDWKDKEKEYDQFGKPHKLQEWKNDIGFIAQDVQKVIPELVRENEDGMLSMRHQGVAPILLEAIKELKAEIEELKLNKCNCNK